MKTFQLAPIPSGRKRKANKLSTGAVIGILAVLLLPAYTRGQRIAPTSSSSLDPPLEVIPQETYVLQRPAPAAIRFRPTISASAYSAAKQAAAANYSAGPVPLAPVPAAPATTVLKNFSGDSQVDATRPPDTEGAAGATQFVETTNNRVNIYNKADGSLAKSVSLASFFNYTTQGLFDPRVVYDPVWKRWIVTADAFAESSTVQKFFFAISKTSSATGAFYVYNANVTAAFLAAGDFWDFPQVGFDQDAVIFTANVFASNDAYRGAYAFAIAKALLYNGRAVPSIPFFAGLVGTLAPPIVLDQNANTFLIAAPTSGNALTKYTMTNSSHPASIALTQSSIPVTAYSVPPNAHQFGTTDLLDTSDSRFVNVSTQNGNDLWQTHTVALNGSATPKFYRINTGTNTISQTAFLPNQHVGRFQCLHYGEREWRQLRHLERYRSRQQPQCRGDVLRQTQRRCGDPRPGGTMGVISSTFYSFGTETPKRWGDYSAITIDPSSTSKAWLVNEKINSTTVWGSQISCR